MLERVFPIGTVFKDVIIEISGPISFGQADGLIPHPHRHPAHYLLHRTVVDAVVVDFGMRSLTALPVPVDINHLPVQALKWLPGVGKNRAATVAAKRPYRFPGSIQERWQEPGSTNRNKNIHVRFVPLVRSRVKCRYLPFWQTYVVP